MTHCSDKVFSEINYYYFRLNYTSEREILFIKKTTIRF